MYLSLTVALPGSLAVYPQVAEFTANQLEPQFATITDKDGNKVSRFFANKGL